MAPFLGMVWRIACWDTDVFAKRLSIDSCTAIGFKVKWILENRHLHKQVG